MTPTGCGSGSVCRESPIADRFQQRSRPGTVRHAMISKMVGLRPAVHAYGYSQAQYSFLVATVIGSAVVPTLVANAFFMPSHLLSAAALSDVAEAVADGAT